MKIIYITAGAAGMFCGSCMHDNALARALTDLGHDVQLIPLYTPVRLDEPAAVSERLFFGGINVYLQQNIPLFRKLPAWFDRVFDQPWLLKWASQKSVKIRAQELGELTVSMLRGVAGNQRKEVDRLVAWIVAEQPDAVIFTNALVAGAAPEIRRRWNCKLVVTFQGDDIFLNELAEPFQTQARAEMQRLGESVDVLLTNSNYYADHMAGLLRLPRDKFRIVPLGLDTRDFTAESPPAEDRPPTVGYLARLAPEKGLHQLADAFLRLRSQPGCEHARLRIAGWLGGHHREYAEQVLANLHAAAPGAVAHVGEVDRRGKLEFLRSIDVLSVPTTYRDPKGLYVLEALAAGVPVVQPNHGAFPEVLQDTGGGVLVAPDDPTELAAALADMLRNPERRRQLAREGRAAVPARRNARAMAEQTLAAIQS